MAEPEVEKAKVKVKKKRSWKLILTCFVISFGCIFVLLLVTGLLWFTGYISRQVCPNFTSSSDIYDVLNCADLEQIKPDEETQDNRFPIKEGSDQGSPQVTEEEVVVSNVFEKVSPAVVAIGAKKGGESQVIGSGFVVSPSGLVVTNQHVVSDVTAEYFVSFKDKQETIVVKDIYRDVLNDIALMEIEGGDFPFIALGDSDKLKPGQTVIAIGNPLGSLEGTVTSGIISGLHREVKVGSGFGFGPNSVYEDVIQTDAAINPGNSGGPLLNSSSEVIGVSFARVAGADNLSFALPINRVKKKIQELNEFGRLRVPFIGVAYTNKLVFINGESVIGASVSSVVTDGPAEAAGILSGDVIVAFNSGTFEGKSLTIYIQEQEIGAKAKLTILRNGATSELEVTIGERGGN
ncbi:trypsin-like peptidase domain-containing protein [Candidatus Dojkabacteria bacterium]|nr:trypsin-like peptidase domain-containing protein [Candidatus Dojkabacteria bacterium]